MKIKKNIAKELKKIINDTINKNYKKSQKKTIRERYKEMSKGFDEIMNVMETHYAKEAKSYYKVRSKNDARLKKIQAKAFGEITTCIKNSDCFNIDKKGYELVPASSFSARTNIVGESDIDFGVLIKNISDDKVICFANALGKCGYILTEIRNKHSKKKKHWVFQKFIKNVEIEAKVRDYDGFKEIHKMHQFTDKKMKKRDKIFSTYAKYILKKHMKNEYEKFKMIYYCNAGYHGKSKELMYKLL